MEANKGLLIEGVSQLNNLEHTAFVNNLDW